MLSISVALLYSHRILLGLPSQGPPFQALEMHTDDSVNEGAPMVLRQNPCTLSEPWSKVPLLQV